MKIRTMAMIAGLSLAAPVAAIAAPQPVAVETVKSSAPAQSQQADTSSYAAREAQDKKVADYEGGNTVVIAMSGGALVVLLLLLLIL
jgi:methionine-rich copper-binding protein CopC